MTVLDQAKKFLDQAKTFLDQAKTILDQAKIIVDGTLRETVLRRGTPGDPPGTPPGGSPGGGPRGAPRGGPGGPPGGAPRGGPPGPPGGPPGAIFGPSRRARFWTGSPMFLYVCGGLLAPSWGGGAPPGGPPGGPKSAHFFGYLITLPVGTKLDHFWDKIGPPGTPPEGPRDPLWWGVPGGEGAQLCQDRFWIKRRLRYGRWGVITSGGLRPSCAFGPPSPLQRWGECKRREVHLPQTRGAEVERRGS